MTPAQHRAEASRLLIVSAGEPVNLAVRTLGEAQVHAILSLHLEAVEEEPKAAPRRAPRKRNASPADDQ
jgi:hypothetical protein